MRLKTWRAAENLTLSEAADRIGETTGMSVHRYETGESMPRPEICERIRLASDGLVTVQDLLDEYLERRGPQTIAASRVAE